MEPIDEFSDPKNPYASPLISSRESEAVANDDFQTEDFRPFRTIWTHPRVTVRRIIAVNPELHVVLLVCLAGVGESLDRASMRSVGDTMPVAAILGLACVFGPLGGLVGLWIGSHLIRLSGTWIGGTATREHIKTAIAWSSVPAV